MSRPADTLQQPHHVARRMHQHDQIDRADVHAEFQTRAADDRPQFAALETLLHVAAPVRRQRRVMHRDECVPVRHRRRSAHARRSVRPRALVKMSVARLARSSGSSSATSSRTNVTVAFQRAQRQ